MHKMWLMDISKTRIIVQKLGYSMEMCFFLNPDSVFPTCSIKLEYKKQSHSLKHSGYRVKQTV